MENHPLSNKLDELEEELYETKNFIKLMYMAVSSAWSFNLIITINLVPHSHSRNRNEGRLISPNLASWHLFPTILVCDYAQKQLGNLVNELYLLYVVHNPAKSTMLDLFEGLDKTILLKKSICNIHLLTKLLIFTFSNKATILRHVIKNWLCKKMLNLLYNFLS